MGVPSNSDDQRLRCVTEVLRKRHKRCSRGARARGRLHLEEAETARSGHQISRDLNDSGPLLRFQKGTGKETPEPLSRKSDGHPIGPNPTQLSPPPRLNAPRTFEKGPRLRRGGSRGARSSRITHRRSAGRSRGPAPTGPSWRTAGESQVPFDLWSRLRPPLRRSPEACTSSCAIRPLPPKRVRPLFTPTSRGRGTGNTNPPIVPHHAPAVPNGGSRGGPQFTNRSCPGAVPDARSVAPPDWSVLAPFLQSNGSAGPSHLGPPLCLGWSGL